MATAPAAQSGRRNRNQIRQSSNGRWSQGLHSRRIGSKVVAGEIGVPGKGVALLPVHQETNLRDLRKVSVEGADDRKQGERLRLDAGRVGFDKRSAQVDDGYGARCSV